MTELSRLGRSRVLLGLTTALLVACSGGSAASTPPSPPPPVATASATATAADSKTRPTTVPTTAPTASRAADIVVGGDRPVTVHVPPGYDPSRPAPLLIGLHGYASNGQEHASYFHIDDAAAQRGYLYAWPNGTLDSQQNRFWNATDACCDHEGSGVDDAAYLETLIKEIEGKFTSIPSAST